jgi:glycosyltransferase involved in cell wall biosynthesis/SAM-dependent methyltransferase
MKELVSVVLTSYNHEQYIEQALDSLLNQTYGRLEIIVLDDCSTDGSRSRLGKYRGRPGVRLVFLGKNTGGYTHACNLGASLSRGKYLLFAQSDDFSEPTKIESLVSKFTGRDSVGVVYCRSYLVDENSAIIGDDFRSRERRFKQLCSRDALIPRQRMVEFLSSSCVIPNLSAVLIKKEYFDALHGLDTKYKVCSDWDFWFRLAGFCDFYYVAAPLNYFRQHRTTIRGSHKMVVQLLEIFEILDRAVNSNRLSPAAKFRFKVNMGYVGAHYLIFLREREEHSGFWSVYGKLKQYGRSLWFYLMLGYFSNLYGYIRIKYLHPQLRAQYRAATGATVSRAEFYDDWYGRGYMDEWPIAKKKRVFELIRSLGLPQTGAILDYGCGNGVFTAVLKQALPLWQVYGNDISAVAIANAKERQADCSFYLASDPGLRGIKFDFLFSHHVLEHVDDIAGTWREMAGYLKERGSSLHILPCGNQGSFEQRLCLSRKDGIDRAAGNRFGFEDKSHLRRLTTEQMNIYAGHYDLRPVFGYYSNQFYGALDWITLSSPLFILALADPRQAKDIFSALKLTGLCVSLLLIKFLRFPANTIDQKKRIMGLYRYSLLSLALLIFYPLSKSVNVSLRFMSEREWKKHKNNQRGSEMYLYYTRAEQGKVV